MAKPTLALTTTIFDSTRAKDGALTRRLKMKTSNNKARALVVDRKDFKGSNLFAETWRGIYAVYSYGYHFPIYAFVDGKWYANEDKYSRSTTRHQSQARPEWQGEKMEWVCTRELQRLIAR
jgi:hypothetical protein